MYSAYTNFQENEYLRLTCSVKQGLAMRILSHEDIKLSFEKNTVVLIF